MMDPLLGISIPTYRRAAYLDKLLSRLTIDLSRLNFPIYVSDNSPDTATQEVAARYATTYPNLSYFRNPGDHSFASNLLNSLKVNEASYVWFLGDDDVPFEYAFDRLVPWLRKGYDFVVGNYLDYQDEGRETREWTKRMIKSWPKQDVVVEGGQVRFALFEWFRRVGFLSFIVMRKELLLNALRRDEFDPTSPYVHTILWGSALLKSDQPLKGVVLSNPLVKRRDVYDDNFVGFGRFRLKLEERKVFLNLSKQLGDAGVIRQYDGLLQYKVVTSAMWWGAHQYLRLSEARFCVNNYDGLLPWTKLAIVLASLLPKRVLRFIT